MASRKEEKERLRQARIEAEKQEASAQRRRLLLGYVAAGAIAAVVIAGIAVVALSGGGGAEGAAHINTGTGDTNGVEPDEREGTEPAAAGESRLEVAAREAGCTLRENLPDEGASHLEPGTTEPDYQTNPPTSGDHIIPPLQQADGAYAEMPEPINFVHSLEHGRIEIQYGPDLPERDQLALKGLYDTMYGGALLFPNTRMPFAVAVTAWRNLMGCERYQGARTLDAIRAFGATYFSTAPEPAESFALDGPTPATPAG